MQLLVLIEPVSGNGFLARVGEPLTLSADGTTRQEALDNLRRAVESHWATGVEIACIDVPDRDHPLARFAGTLKDEPLYDDWQSSIDERRRQQDDD